LTFRWFRLILDDHQTGMITFAHAGFRFPGADEVMTCIFDVPQCAFGRTDSATEAVNQVQTLWTEQLCGELELCPGAFLSVQGIKSGEMRWMRWIGPDHSNDLLDYQPSPR
jgi:hypothetical protein